MTLVILSIHSMRGDVVVGCLFLLVIWLLAKAMMPCLHMHGMEGSERLARIQMLMARSNFERKRTRILTGGRIFIVGDWPHAHFPQSRANLRKSAP